MSSAVTHQAPAVNAVAGDHLSEGHLLILLQLSREVTVVMTVTGKCLADLANLPLLVCTPLYLC